MGKQIQIQPIGLVRSENGVFTIEIESKFREGLKSIEGFTHLQIVWWGNLYDKPSYRSHLVAKKPYKKGPDSIGVFATRSPVRPNPVLISTIYVERIDMENGIIYTPYIDADDYTPVLDIKTYHPSERVKDCQVPEWCNHWPKWYEDAGEFDWGAEFNF
ncbi:MAG: TrmO family methyltransferase [Bacteroidales bacterium]|nr:TrmO family methyltransferase [Bacteroidales bacterium]